MKKLILLSAILVSFTFTYAQNIDKLKKRELRELANTQKEQLLVKNNKIDDQANIILNSSARISELIQIKTQLENFKLSSLDSINNLSIKNAIIPGLKNEIIKLTDSINSINNLLSAYTSQDSFSSNQNSYGFLNNLYTGSSKIENQTFRLVPAGVIARNMGIGYNTNRRRGIPQFIPLAKLNFGIQEKKNTFLSQGTSLKNVKKYIEENYKTVSSADLYNLHPEIFSTFSFIKGKLLTITNENVSKDFLFSVKKSTSEASKNLGQKGLYFSLTDDNEKEYLLELIVINNEVYLMINSGEGYEGRNDSLENIGMKWSVTHSYNSKVVKYWTDSNGYERSDSKGMDSNDKFIGDYYKYQAEYYLECDQFYISPWLVPSTYESSVKITPDMFLFKLEEI